MTLHSWNVNGLRAALKKGFGAWLENCGADVVCLQEVKARPEQVPEDPFAGWHVAWNPADKAGYSGVLTLSRDKPAAVRHGMGIDDHDCEGRVLVTEFDELFVVNCYTPNSQNELRRLPYRQQWDKAFREFILGLDSRKPVLVGGDLNVAHEKIDIARPKANRFSAGFSDQERAGMTAHLEAGFVDSFRHLHPEARNAYSWWSFRGGARERNVGWRLDYWLASKRLAEHIKAAEIHTEVTGSDHCPVALHLR